MSALPYDVRRQIEHCGTRQRGTGVIPGSEKIPQPSEFNHVLSGQVCTY
jgi:hypothetical protein